ncbi:flavin reductase family protein [Streptomyces sp. NBC_00582]|uniref:flavin reductase family protein n=1 Tax=Streptomyces sp. NBC_00582 TaxID=2975783 RepID=UPI002E822DB5|nr:flavin reductase family protein [Streptomyces sp. NBC_00582]WUB67475.1 flavin reductase family protein [Streptomyces sp. NBC_00582]
MVDRERVRRDGVPRDERRPEPATALDERTLREAFSCFPSGVIAMCGTEGDDPVGMAVSSFTSVSLAPPLVSVCLQTSSRTWRSLRALPQLGLSVLGEGQDTVCRALAGREEDRFTGVRWKATEHGAVFVHGAIAWFDCTLRDELPAGDHAIALLEVGRLWTVSAADPLVFHGSRFRRLDSGERSAVPA